MKRYELLAEDLALSIKSGMLKVGERLPSVRQISTSRGVSVSTVFEAYYLLESRGLIRARDRSGYYVTAGTAAMLPEPTIHSSCGTGSLAVKISELVFSILESIKTRDVVPLASAFPSPLLFPLPRLARALARGAESMDPWDTVDDITQGNPTLRRQIAMRYVADGMPVHPDDVDMDRLAQALAEHKPKACWIMTNFQNPLGSLMPDEKKRAMVDLLAAHGVPLIEDDVYGELYFGQRRPLPAKAFEQDGLVLHCSSFSKCLAPGYRIGWALPGKFRQSVSRLKITSTLAAATPVQEALSEYLAKGGYDRHLRQLRHTLSLQQSAMLAAVLSHFPAGTKASRPEGGYVMWIEFPVGVDALALQRDACLLNISVAPGPMFSARGEFRNCIRLNYGHHWDAAIEKAIVTLGALARVQLGACQAAPAPAKLVEEVG